MKMKQLASGSFVIIVLMTVCGQSAIAAGKGKPSVDRSKEEAALRALDLAWSDTANRKDVDGTVSYMAEDGETLAPNAPAARDKAGIKTSWAGLIALPGFNVHWEPLRVQVAESGEIGYTSGVYTLTFTDANGKTVTERGKYVEVWKKVDGKWKCSSDIYNSDIPSQ